MGSNLDEDSDISESDINEYKEIPYELLNAGIHKVLCPNGSLRCPFCPGKENQGYLFSHLLQHAKGVAKGFPKRSAKQKANHLALVTFLEGEVEVMKHIGGDDYNSLQRTINEMNKQLKEKEEESEYLEDLTQVLIVKERQTNGELQEARKALIAGLNDMLCGSRVNIGVKRMGEIDERAFKNACKRKFSPQEAEMKAVELVSLWQERMRNHDWFPFRVIEDNRGNFKSVIKEDDRLLQGLRYEWGDEVYKSVTTALKEMQEYNPSGDSVVSELWNFRENRKAPLGEGVNFVCTLLKSLKRKRT